MLYHVDAKGRLSTDITDDCCTLHVFTTSLAPYSITIINWRTITGWEPHWTGYAQHPDTMKAYKLLVGHTPHEFYQLKIIVTQLQRQQAGAGPFMLPSVRDRPLNSTHIERLLRQLNERERAAALNSMRLAQFI